MAETSEIVIVGDGSITGPVLNGNFNVIKAILDQLLALGGDTIAVVYLDAEEPNAPNEGALWLDTDTNVLNVYKEGVFVPVSSGGEGGASLVYVQALPPDAPEVGTLWFDTTASSPIGEGANGDPDAPENPTADDDEFSGPALDDVWDWTNQGTAIVNFERDDLILIAPADDNNLMHAIYKPVLAGDSWCYETKIYPEAGARNYGNFGIDLRTGDGAKTIGFQVLQIDGVNKVNSSTLDGVTGAYTGPDYGGLINVGFPAAIYLRAEKVTVGGVSTLNLYFSYNGRQFELFTSIAEATLSAPIGFVGLHTWRNGANRQTTGRFAYIRRIQ